MPIGFKDLIQTVKALNPLITHITPAQTVCNYMSLFFRNAASILSDGRRERHVAAVHGDHDAGRAGRRTRPNGEGGPRPRRRTAAGA